MSERNYAMFDIRLSEALNEMLAQVLGGLGVVGREAYDDE